MRSCTRWQPLRARELRSTQVHVQCTYRCDGILETVATVQVERVLRSTMEWPNTARQRKNELSSPRELTPSLVLFRVLPSLYLSHSLMTILDRGAHANVDRCVCARYLTTIQFSCHQYLQGCQEHRLLHLDQGTRAILGARNAPLQELCLGQDLVFC